MGIVNVTKDVYTVAKDPSGNISVSTIRNTILAGVINNTITIPDASTSLTIVAPITTITVAPGSTISSIGIIGPAGPAGPMGPPSVEEEVPFAKQINFISDNLLYRGEADPGTATSAALWRVRKITIDAADSDVTETWASGTANFDKIWDNHLGFTYT